MKFRKNSMLFTIILLSTISILAGCGVSPTPFKPASPSATQIYNLMVFVFSVIAVVFVVVEGLLIYSSIRFKGKPGEPPPPQDGGNHRFESVWTAIIAVALLVIFIISATVLFSVSNPPASASANSTSQSVHVRVVGHQWWWEFIYPDLKFTTAGEMHVPVNTTVYLDIESVDVIHSYWVPQLGGKMDAIPGRTNHTWFIANSIANYLGECSEYCGVEHAYMHFNVVVESTEDFQTWAKNQQQPAAPATGAAVAGEQAFFSSGCSACHTVVGSKAQGKLGPNLTHVATRKIIAGGILSFTPQDLGKWLTNPQTVKHGALMPNLHLTPQKVNDLITYLSGLK